MTINNAGYSFDEAINIALRASLIDQHNSKKAAASSQKVTAPNELRADEYLDECTITSETFKALAEAHNLAKTRCGHKFSRSDIVEWIHRNPDPTCPNCRAAIDEPSLVIMEIAKERLAQPSPSNSAPEGGGKAEATGIEEMKNLLKSKFQELLGYTDNLICEIYRDDKSNPSVDVKFWCTQDQEAILESIFNITVRYCDKSFMNYLSLRAEHLARLFCDDDRYEGMRKYIHGLLERQLQKLESEA